MVTDSNNNLCSSPKTEVSRRSIIVCVIVLSLLAATISLANYRLHFNGFLLNDYHEYCQIARNFYEGNGYSTSVLRPIAYKFFTTLPHPEVTRMPLYPYFLSLFFHLVGPNDNAVVLFNAVCYVILIGMVFMVAVELSKSAFIGIVAALMTAFMESFLFFTLAAEPNIFYAAMFMAFFYFYLKHPDKILLHGILLGVLYQLRANTLFVFIGFFIALLVGGNGWKARLRTSLLLISGYAIGLMPYMVRNYMVIGKPLFSLYRYSLLLLTSGFPQYTVWTQITDVDPGAYAISHPGEIISKSLGLFFRLASDILPFYKPAVLILIGIGLFSSMEDSRLKSLKLMIISGIITQTLFVMPVGGVPYYYMFFFPLIITVALSNMKDHLKKYSSPVFLVALSIFIWTTVPYWKGPKPANPLVAIGRQISEVTGKSDIILTDIPWEITWYANRRTVWLPYDLETLNKISRTLKPKYVVLTGLSYAAYKDDVWNHMLRDQAFAKSVGFEFQKPIKIGDNTVALLYKAID